MSREDWEPFEQMRRERQEKKQIRREDWADMFDAGELPGWKRCHDTHYQTTLKGDLLDYWPGTMKWRWRGITKTGNVLKFIHNEMLK